MGDLRSRVIRDIPLVIASFAVGWLTYVSSTASIRVPSELPSGVTKKMLDDRGVFLTAFPTKFPDATEDEIDLVTQLHLAFASANGVKTKTRSRVRTIR